MLKEKEVELFYDNVGGTYGDHDNRLCDEILEYFILKYLPNRKIKILDAGGGIGRFSIPLAKKENLVVLSDISQVMLENAEIIAKKNKIKNIQFVKESVTDMKNQNNNSFDVVLAMNAILDYCENHDKALKEIFRVLKPGGVLIGSVNNRFIYCTEHELNDGNFKLFRKSMDSGDRFISWRIKKGHWTHEFTLDELNKSIKARGFRIVKVLGVFNLLGKYAQQDWLKDRSMRKKLFLLQIQYAEKEEYVNNSTDYFFVAKKPMYL
ncbi:MAG: class I SAM-dependent methyltransferase [Candidatus Woesearchaeota archaeon]